MSAEFFKPSKVGYVKRLFRWLSSCAQILSCDGKICFSTSYLCFFMILTCFNGLCCSCVMFNTLDFLVRWRWTSPPSGLPFLTDGV